MKRGASGAHSIDDPGAEPSSARADTGSALPLAGLYRDQSSKLRRFFNRRGNQADTEDLVQESFVRLAAADARAPLRIDQPGAYLSRIARNLVHEQARFAARRSAAMHVDIDDVPVVAEDPIARLEARDMLARLERAMGRMKPATREIFIAHRVDGYTYREIAEQRGIGVKGVEKQIAKAILVVNRALRDR
jgi:RNA polymerase sigma-70 factor (ECF subfamily)